MNYSLNLSREDGYAYLSQDSDSDVEEPKRPSTPATPIVQRPQIQTIQTKAEEILVKHECVIDINDPVKEAAEFYFSRNPSQKIAMLALTIVSLYSLCWAFNMSTEL